MIAFDAAALCHNVGAVLPAAALVVRQRRHVRGRSRDRYDTKGPVSMMRATNRTPTGHGASGSPRIHVGHLRDRIFAGFGYAFAIAATTVGLLSPRLGPLAIVTGIGLIAVLVPVNISLIRRVARVSHPPATRHDAPPAEPQVTAQRRAPSA